MDRKEFLKKAGNLSIATLGAGFFIPEVQPFRQRPHKTSISSGSSQPAGNFTDENYRLFDEGWEFKRSDVPGAEEIGFNASDWRKIDLPHDWSIEDLPEENQLPFMAISEGDWKFKKGDDTNWKNPSFDDISWKKVNLPDYWNQYSDQSDSGSYGWYRKEIEIPDKLQGDDFLLNIGRIADSDEAFFNGTRIGGTGEFPPDYTYSYYTPTSGKVRAYRVPADLVQNANNVVSVRVYCHNDKGGIYASAPTPRKVGPFSPKSPGGGSTGHTIGGIGWYRKEFRLDEKNKNKHVAILFEGIYMNAETWINGHYLGNHPYGYTSYGYNLTPYLRFGSQPNVVSIKVDNTGRNSRWYSGSGIYRHVGLRISEPVHFSQWGLYVTSPKVSHDNASVKMESTIKNDSGSKKTFEVKSMLFDPEGKQAGQSHSEITLASGDEIKEKHLISVDSPALWSPDDPNLYHAEVRLIQDGKKIDQIETHIGIRSIEVDAKNGLTINGKQVTLKGGCMHHCNGPLGAKAIDRAEERRVELMKKHGFNAIRTSHNPPSPAFLDACDRLGMLVMDEAFDCWDKGKMPMDYHLYFDQWGRKDIESMIKRDRNHPSVVLWSIGNEIPDRVEPRGLKIEKELVDLVHQLDPTRPVTEAINGVPDWSKTAQAYSLLDVGGYNYLWKKYTSDHKKYPDRVMVGTESFPKEALENWRQVEEHPWVIGDFVWSGMDYLGESGIGHSRITGPHTPPPSFGMPWPWYVSYCGDIDICGFKKPQSYYRDVVWKQSMLEMAVHSPVPAGQKERISKWGWPDEQQSWTWNVPNGKKLNVNVYSRYPKVRLELNGQVIGEKSVSEEEKLTAAFEVPYKPGELRVSGIKNGQVVEHKLFKTAGEPKALRLTADRSKIHASRNDLSYVTVEVIDRQDRRVPNADVPIQFEVSGKGGIAAVGNGNPHDMKSFQSQKCKCFKGRCLVILRPDGSGPGTINLEARAKGVSPAKFKIQTV